MTSPDPLLDLARVAEYASSSIDYVRKATKRPENDPERLPSFRHAGKIKVRLSAVDAWIERTSEPAA